MNPSLHLFTEFAGHPATRSIGWFLVHSLWQGALIVAAFAIVRRMIPRAHAQLRYVVGCLALIAILVTPILTVLTGATLRVDSRSTHSAVSSAGFANVAVPSGGSIGGAEPAVMLDQLAALVETSLPLLVVIWVAGVLGFSARLAHGFWSIRTLRGGGTGPADPEWLKTFHRLKRRFQISRPVCLLKSAVVEVPTVIGWLKPVILLPASRITGLTPPQIETLIAHELAHVARWDYLVNALQSAIEALMFYHPGVWWISNCVREEREHCCDDLVVKVCGDRTVYARALVTLESWRVEVPQPALAASGGSLLLRIRRLLGGSEQESKRDGIHVCGVALLWIGLTLIMAGAFLWIVPTRYEALTRIRLEPGAISGSTLPTDALIRTEIGMVASPTVLRRVINATRSGGENVPAENGELRDLRHQIRVRAVPGTTLIEIRAVHANQERAARLANDVADAYREFSMELHRAEIAENLAELERHFAERSKRVETARVEMERLRSELRVTDSDPGSLVPSPALSLETLRQVQKQLATLQTDCVRMERQLEGLRKLTQTQLRAAIQTVVDGDKELSSLQEALRQAEERVVLLAGDYGSDHPTLKNAARLQSDLEQKVDQRIAGILIGLENRLDSNRAAVKSLQKEIATAKELDLAHAEASRPYFEAKRRVFEEQQFVSMLGARVTSMKTEEYLPRNQRVQIVDRALATTTPRTRRQSTSPLLLASGCICMVSGGVLLKKR